MYDCRTRFAEPVSDRVMQLYVVAVPHTINGVGSVRVEEFRLLDLITPDSLCNEGLDLTTTSSDLAIVPLTRVRVPRNA